MFFQMEPQNNGIQSPVKSFWIDLVVSQNGAAPQSSSILDWDFPLQTNIFGVPSFMENPICQHSDWGMTRDHRDPKYV